MSIVANSGVNYIPGLVGRIAGSPYLNTYTMNESGDHCGAIGRIPKTGTLTKIGIRTGTVTTSDTLLVALEGVDLATGRPDAVVTPANASGTQGSLSGNTTYWVALNGGSGVSVTKDALFALTIRFNSYVAGNLNINYSVGNTGTTAFPYAYTYNATGAAWAFSNSCPNFAFEYSDGSIVCPTGYLPACTTTAVTWNSTSSPDRQGLRVSLPQTHECSGVIIAGDFDQNTAMLLYDSDATTLLENVTQDTDVRQSTSGGVTYFPFSTNRILTANTFYRVVLLPSTTTPNIRIDPFDVTNDGANAAMAAIDGGVNFHYTTCNGVPSNEASWTQTLTRRPPIALVESGVDVSSGGPGPRILNPVQNQGIYVL